MNSPAVLPGGEHSSPGGPTRLGRQSVEGAVHAASNERSKKEKLIARLRYTLDKINGTAKFGPIEELLGGLKDIIESPKQVSENRKEYQALLEILGRLLEVVEPFSDNRSGTPQIVAGSIKNFCGSINEELSAVLKRLNRTSSRKLIDADRDFDEICACYERIHSHMEILLANLSLSTLAILGVHEQESQGHYIRTLIDKLNLATSAPYACVSKAKRGPCADGTRSEVLEQMLEWVHTGTGSVYWINGIAGTGKTTICYSLCRKLESMNQLAASFFCTGTLPECKAIGNIFPSIAYQLAAFSPHYAHELYKILRNNYGIVMSDLRTQYKQLIEGLLRLPLIRNALPSTVVVVIDALDECESEGTDISDILDLLLGTEHSVSIKFFVSSRPRLAIQKQFTNRQYLQKNQIALHKLDKTKVQKDIRTYLDAEFRRLDPPSRSLAIPKHYIDKLASRSGELFIYASTAVNYIRRPKYANSPLLGLEALLNAPHSSEAHSHKSLDQLYTTILDEAFEDDMLSREEKEVMKLVLHTIICVQEPLTIAELNTLLKLRGEEEVLSALEPFLSVLYIAEMEPSESKSNQRVATIHISFLDFMFDAGRSKEWYCKASTRHDALSDWCFEGIQQASPKFNICGLESSHELDDDVAGLKDRVDAAISNQLFYACRYWSTHYSLSSRSPGLLRNLEAFFSYDLLLWMEVMNLNKVIRAGPNIIHCAINCLNQSSRCLSLARDSLRFVTSFAANPVSRSTAHIYVSMLAFWPHSTPVSQHYRPRMHGAVKLEGKVVRSTKPVLLAEWPLCDKGHAAALSPDGDSIVVTSGKSLQILDIITGLEVYPRMEGHNDLVVSVDFSPNGRYIASGSLDTNVHLWDARSHEQLRLLIGHEQPVYAVAFSPDNATIATGSGDRTIRIWVVESGQEIHKITGHNDSIYTVRFSPDGKGILSGSNDWSVRLWNTSVNPPKLWVGPPPILKHVRDQVSFKAPIAPDVHSQLKRLHRPLESEIQRNHKPQDTRASELEELIKKAKEKNLAHTIYSVAFAPDALTVASGSRDGTVRLWDPKSGDQICKLLHKEGSGSINCVAFTPDGMHVVAGTADGTVCVWNVKEKRVVLGPLIGHQGLVSWVGCSRDGARIFSVSIDKTVRVWDLEGEQTPRAPELSSDHAILALGLSQNGTRIISGGKDLSVKQWDAQNGQQTNSPVIRWYKSRATSDSTEIESAAISYDCKQVVFASQDNLHLWVEGHHQKRNESYPGLRFPTFSHDGKHVAAASGKGLFVLDLSNGNVQDTVIKDLRVTSIAYSPDDTLIAAGMNNGLILLWTAGVPLKENEFKGKHHTQVTSVAFSSTGSLLVSGSSDTSVCVWATKAGESMLDSQAFKGHTGPIHAVRFIFEDKCVLSAAENDGIYLWDANNGAKLLGPLSWHTRLVSAIGYSPTAEGIRVVSGFNDGSIIIWKSELFNLSDEVTAPMHDRKTTWKMQDDGWIKDEKSRHLVWVPYDLRPIILPAQAELANHAKYRVRLKLEGARIGDSWIHCYLPQTIYSATNDTLWEWSSTFLSTCYYSLFGACAVRM